MRQWFTMQATEATAEINIYDEIGKSFWNEDAIGAKDFLESLVALGDIDSITLRINSPGGDVFDGVAIHNALKNHKAKVTAQIDGLAASIASYIAMAADKIVMPANAFMLVHNASGFVFGTAEDMREIANDLDRIDKSITATYVARSGSKREVIKQLMKEDRLMDAKEAKELGFADDVIAEKKLAASYSLRLLPKAAAERLRAETGLGEDPPPQSDPGTPEEPAPVPPVPPAVEPPVLQPAPSIDDYKAYVSTVTDLCVLAGKAERVAGYIKDDKSVEEVRKDLLALRAEQAQLLPQHPLVTKPPPPAAPTWDKITDKLNARHK